MADSFGINEVKQKIQAAVRGTTLCFRRASWPEGKYLEYTEVSLFNGSYLPQLNTIFPRQNTTPTNASSKFGNTVFYPEDVFADDWQEYIPAPKAPDVVAPVNVAAMANNYAANKG